MSTHRFQACEPRQRHEAWKLDKTGGFHVEQEGSIWFVVGTVSGFTYQGCHNPEDAEKMREAILKQAEAGE